jgi:polysaccharide transporter, PST family
MKARLQGMIAVRNVDPVDGEQAPRGFIGRGSAVTLTGQGMKILLQLAAMASLGRLLLPTDFGLMGMITPLLTFFIIFRDLGLSNVAIQRPHISGQEITNLFWINVGAGCLLAAAVAGLGPAIAAFYREPRLGAVVVFLSVTFVVNGISAQYLAFLQRNFRISQLVLIDVASTALGIAAGVGAAWKGFGYWSLALVPVATQSSSLVLAVATSKWQPGVPRLGRQVLGMLHMGAGFAGFNLFNFLSRNLDNILVGRTLGAAPLGFYSRAYNLMLVPLSQVTNPLAQVMVPALSRLTNDPPAYRSAYIGMLQKIMFFCCPMVTANIVGSDWTVGLLLGPNWAPASELYMVLGISALVQPVGNSTGWLFISQGRSKDMLGWGIVSSIAVVASFIIGLHWGILGLAWSYTVVIIGVITPTLWYWVGRHGPVGFGDLAGATLPFLLVSGIDGLLFLQVRHYWTPSPIPGLIAAVSWHFAVQAALLSLHPRTRPVIRDIRGVATRFLAHRVASLG